MRGGVEEMDLLELSRLRFQVFASSIHQKTAGTNSFSSTNGHGRWPCQGVSRRTLHPLVRNHQPQRATRGLESVELRIPSPLICLRQFPPLSRLPEPEHVRSHRLSEPRDIPPSSPLQRTSRPTRPSTPNASAWREIK